MSEPHGIGRVSGSALESYSSPGWADVLLQAAPIKRLSCFQHHLLRSGRKWGRRSGDKYLAQVLEGGVRKVCDVVVEMPRVYPQQSPRSASAE